MITVIERTSGWTIASDGQVLAHLTDAEADELRAKLTDALQPVSTAVTPAKARLMRYPIKATK